jgi:hypothetical protein
MQSFFPWVLQLLAKMQKTCPVMLFLFSILYGKLNKLSTKFILSNPCIVYRKYANQTRIDQPSNKAGQYANETRPGHSGSSRADQYANQTRADQSSSSRAGQYANQTRPDQSSSSRIDLTWMDKTKDHLANTNDDQSHPNEISQPRYIMYV